MSEECWECKMNYPLEHWAGYGWYHFNPDGGPDIKCTNPEVMVKPNPDDGEEEYE